MTTPKNRLEVRVELVNKVHTFANAIQPKLIEFFKPFVGQTILKNPTNRRPVALLDQIEKAASEQFREKQRGYLLRYCGSPYKLQWKIVGQTTDDNDASLYYECNIPIGDISDPILTQVSEPSNFKTDYVYSDILAKTKKTEKLRQTYETAKRDLLPFNEFV